MADWEANWVVVGDRHLAGGQGRVQKVVHRTTGATGALKQLHDEFLGNNDRRWRMNNEADALSVLNGDGVPTLIDANTARWQERGVPLFIVMEWIEGVTLHEHCITPMPLDHALSTTERLLTTMR